ncbi:MAG TPA: hypothetical protein VGA49_01190 [Patescibacteria group bacterium]
MIDYKKFILPTALIIIIFIINLVAVFPLLQGEHSQFTESIAVSHAISSGYFINLQNVINPFWYTGFTKQIVYPVLSLILISLPTLFIKGLSIFASYRIITGLFYILIPCSLFILLKYLTKNNLIPFFLTLIYSVGPAVSASFLPIEGALAEFNIFLPWRLLVYTLFGEGPHIISLFFIPLGLIVYIKLLKKGGLKSFILFILIASAVLLTDLFGALALALICLIILISELFLKNSQNKFKTSFWALMAILGLIAFHYNPYFFELIFKSGYAHRENSLSPGWPLIWILLILALFIFFYFFENKYKKNQLLQHSLVFTGAVVVLGLITVLAFYFDYSLLPQAKRYVPEFNLAAITLISLIGLYLHDSFKLSKKFIIKHNLPAILALILAASLYNFWPSAQTVIKPGDITQSTEYKIAQYLTETTSQLSGQKIYLTGPPSFWLNAFSDLAQIKGAQDFVQPSRWWADIVYQIEKGEDPRIAISWLKLLNVQKIVVNNQLVSTPFMGYQNFTRPNKFVDQLRLEEVIDDSNIYSVNLINSDLVQLVDFKNIKQYSAISNVLDQKNLAGLVKTIEKGPANYQLNYDINQPDLIQIKVTAGQSDQALLFKSFYNPNWRAFINNQKYPIKKFGPDLMLIEPNLAGDYTIEIKAAKSLSQKIGATITLLTLIILIIISVSKKKPLFLKLS